MSFPLADSIIAVYMDSKAVSHPEFEDVAITPTEYVIRFCEGHIATEPVAPDCSVRSLFGIGAEEEGEQRQRGLFRSSLTKEQKTPGEMKALVVTKTAPEIAVPIQCESREGYPVVACLTCRVSINPVDSIRLVRLMGRRLRIAGKLKASLSRHYNVLAKEDLGDLLSNHLQDLFVQNHAVSKYTSEEISGQRESIETDIRALLEKEIEDGYWLEQYGFTMTVASVNISKTDLERIEDDLKREEDDLQIRMIRESQLLNLQARQEENRHALEELHLKNRLVETRLREDILRSENEWRTREYNEYVRRREVEAQHALDRQRIEDDMKVDLARRLSELKNIDRERELEYREKLMEIEKLRLESEMKMSQKMLLPLKGILDAMDIAKGDVRPSRRMCPVCGKDLQGSREVCEHCGATIQVDIRRNQLDIDRQLTAARHRRDLILGELLKLDTRDETDLEEEIARRLSESLTQGNRITLTIAPPGAEPVIIPVSCFATIFKHRVGNRKRVVIASDDQTTFFPEGWNMLPIQYMPFHIFYVRNRPFLYIEEDREHPESRDRYIRLNGNEVKAECYHEMARGAQLVVNSQYTITIS